LIAQKTWYFCPGRLYSISDSTMIFNPNLKMEAEYYANLEIKNGSDFEQVKAAYKNLIKKYHPDKFNGSEEKRKMAEIITTRLNEAYTYFEKKFNKKA
jgi:DnaJ-class molecular chaperone